MAARVRLNPGLFDLVLRYLCYMAVRVRLNAQKPLFSLTGISLRVGLKGPYRPFSPMSDHMNQQIIQTKVRDNQFSPNIT